MVPRWSSSSRRRAAEASPGQDPGWGVVQRRLNTAVGAPSAPDVGAGHGEQALGPSAWAAARPIGISAGALGTKDHHLLPGSAGPEYGSKGTRSAAHDYGGGHTCR
jgi:hypothetical protein